MAVDAPQSEGMTERLNFYLPSALRKRLVAVATTRRTNEAASLRWLLERSLDWFEQLPMEQREAS